MNLQSEKRPNPITVEAFRFVQLKNPKIYNGKWASASLVHHPNPSKSIVLQGDSSTPINQLQHTNKFTDRATVDKSKASAKKANKRAMKEQTTEDDTGTVFHPYTSLSTVRQLNEPLYNFMFWLRENRGRLQQEQLAQKTATLTTLQEEQRLEVWENLFYQTQIAHSATLVEGLVRLLQTDHFLRYYRQVVEGSDIFPLEGLQKAAMASVVLPQQLFESSKEDSNQPSANLDAQSKSILSEQLEVALLQQKISARTQALEEIAAAQKRYVHDNHQEYQEALQAHEAKVEALLQSAQEITNEAGTIKICGQEIEAFDFQPKNTWDDAYLGAQISASSLAIYQYLKTDQHRYMADTRQAIAVSIGDLNREKFRLLQKQTAKTLVHQGIQIPLRNRPLNNAYVFKAVALEGQKELYSIYATHYYEHSATKLRQIEATVKTADGKTQTASTRQPIYETDQYVTVQLFEEGIALPNKQAFTLDGSFKTEDPAYNNNFRYEDVLPEQIEATKAPQANPKNLGIPLPNLFGVMGVKIAEFKKVNQTLCCYTEGEVSHIENIMAREYKERETRNLIRSELTNESTQERESENLSDTTSAERHEVQSEISRVLQEDQSDSAAASASAGGFYKFGDTAGINFNINGSLSTSSSSSSSASFNESEAYAKEITQRAMKRLVEKNTSKRTSKMIREFEEKNKHGFDNRKGNKHVTGVYRWVDKIYKNDLVNYGKRLMYEFMLPEPARNYKHLLVQNLQKNQAQGCGTKVLEKPLSPTEQNIDRYWDITEHNFDDLVAYYGLEIDKYPVRHIKIARSFAENFYQTGTQAASGKLWHGSKNFEFEIPTDYVCKGFDCRFTAKRYGSTENIHGDLIIGTSSYAFSDESVHAFKRGSSPTTIVINLPFGGLHTINIPAFDPVEEYLPIAVATEDVGNFAMTIWAECEIKSEAFDEFRAQFFASMWASYKEMLQAYDDAVYEACLQKEMNDAASKDSETPKYNLPSSKARAIEKREIKRLIIEQVMQKYYQTLGLPNFPIGRDYYQPDPCNNTLNLYTSNSYLNEQLRYARFLEQAFEWEIMAYTFLPYYWNDENNWGDLLNIEASADHIFLAFLQSGMANIVLPVKPGLEKSVAFLLETGRLWNNDGFILDGQDDLYPAIDEQLALEVDAQGNEIKYDDAGRPIPVIEATWETRIPSTLTIVQDYSNPLGDEGLPCFCEEDKSTRIGYADSIEKYNKLEGLTE